MNKKSLYICIIAIVVLIALVLISKENFTSNPNIVQELESVEQRLVPIVRSSIPFPAIKGYELQNTILQKLLQNTSKPTVITKLMEDLRKVSENFGLVLADGVTGVCTGVWMYQKESSSWSLFPVIHEQEYKPETTTYDALSLKIKLQSLGELDHIGLSVKPVNNIYTPNIPDMKNTFWTLVPSHTNGIPALRKLSDQVLEQPLLSV